jgi:hypothetical protein
MILRLCLRNLRGYGYVETEIANFIAYHKCFAVQNWYSLSSERLVDIKITKLYVEKVVPGARKI